MNSTTGSPYRHTAGRCLAVLACLLAWPLLHAVAQAPLWQQDFDSQIPGEQPQGWGRAWGEQGDDLTVISNMLSLSGKNSFLLDRTGTNEAMWGCVAALPDVAKGWVVLSWCFLVQGRGNEANFGFEVREPSLRERVAVVGVADRLVTLQSGDWRTSALLGHYAEDRWYRLTLWLPTREGKQTQSWGGLEERQDDGTWKPVGERQTVTFAGPGPQYGVLMLDTGPGKRNYLLYLDDFRLEVRAVAAGNAPPG